MTTYAPPHPLELVTAALDLTAEEPIVDSLPLLDHRTRSRTVAERSAPRGQYLAFRDGTRSRLLPLDGISHIGRGLSADARIEHQQVSRNHAIIVLHGRFARLLDNRSANGTYVDGRRIIATNLNRGDLIQFGPVLARYVVVD